MRQPEVIALFRGRRGLRGTRCSSDVFGFSGSRFEHLLHGDKEPVKKNRLRNRLADKKNRFADMISRFHFKTKGRCP
ncbi:hypothetical protein EVAR_60344_1 [Eumeta japonica]|uniref:Uncharacterized protein n=1 Tax=Eumeta variegata TaxID=151549 RepID=A0A4C1ZQL2_EUMVA|nr:hypothetical protein EVAR_60344_1 [Eumeta japonica]